MSKKLTPSVKDRDWFELGNQLIQKWERQQFPTWRTDAATILAHSFPVKYEKIMWHDVGPEAIRDILSFASVYLELLMVHLWQRCDWIEHVIYWARVEFNHGTILPKVPGTIELPTELFSTLRLCHLTDASEQMASCIEIAAGGSITEGEHGSDFLEPEVAVLEGYRKDVLSLCATLGPEFQASGDEGGVVSRALLELFDNKRFSAHFHRAMESITHAEVYRVFSAIKTVQDSQPDSGPRSAGYMPAPDHIPPVPTYKPGAPAQVYQVITRHEEIKLDDGMFYFAFGVTVDSLVRDSSLEVRRQLMGGSLGTCVEELCRSARVQAGIEILLPKASRGDA